MPGKKPSFKNAWNHSKIKVEKSDKSKLETSFKMEDIIG